MGMSKSWSLPQNELPQLLMSIKNVDLYFFSKLAYNQSNCECSFLVQVRIQLGQGSAMVVGKNIIANEGFGRLYKVNFFVQ